MIVEYWLDGEAYHVSARRDIDSAITKVIEALEWERPVPVGFFPGTVGEFHVFNVSEISEIPPYAENSLRIGINKETKFGGMTWSGEDSEHSDHFHWITKNDSPPDFDPRVTSDDGHPLWYDRRNVIPIEKIRTAIEEYFFNGGLRPPSLEWEPGTVHGQRLDAKY
ncbi:Imm1 family immunity protein [Streptomyces sp. SCSIO 30461]|uniref:Imm1 family immunity protein n=1 Tax=Streptomyces sp. SCSIO 30461 TaxID=3118085 RepID=UPI0030CA733A